MNDELTKQLQEAGFPFKHFGTGFNEDGTLESRPIVELSELIEACGDEFRKIMFHHLKAVKPKHIEKYGEGVVWSAHSNRHYTDKKYKPTWAKTPEEAVAKLWLELNKKSSQS